MVAIRKHAKEALAVLGLIVVAAGVSVYLLDQQRMRFPWEDAPLRLKAEFSTAQAVTAGQGQTVRVSGVRIGDIGDVKLRDGRAVVEMVIDHDYEGMVRTDAHALLRPKTGFKDMFIDLEPGSDDAPAAKEGFTVPISATAPDVNPDEILSELDAETRDYLKLLIGDSRARPGGPRPRPARAAAALRAHPPRPRAREQRGRPSGAATCGG